MKDIRYAAALLVAAGAGIWSLPATAEPAASGDWKSRLSIYGYLPSVDGESAFPADSSGSSIDIDAEKVLDALEFFFMVSLDVHNGTWGVFTDFIYLDFSQHKSSTRDFSLGSAGRPAGATADLELGLTGTAWTVAGEYRLVADKRLVLDMLVGARQLDIEQTLDWEFSGDLGSFTGSRSGSETVGDPNVDLIVGAKGRYFVDGGHWSVPFYFDVGTGDSKSTVQAAAGIGYSFSWGEISALYRYLGYSAESGEAIESLSFVGPQLGATFRF